MAHEKDARILKHVERHFRPGVFFIRKSPSSSVWDHQKQTEVLFYGTKA